MGAPMVALMWWHPSMVHLNMYAAVVLIRVDQSGGGGGGVHVHHRKIQDAIDSVPSNNSRRVLISVAPGVYREKVVVPADKPFITLSGNKGNGSATVITWADYGDIFFSPTLTIFASDFTALYLTIQNTHGPGAKAVAMRVCADRVALFGCRILSHQDTLLDDRGRHYYKNCYIQGDTDFICGNAASLFEKCHLHSVSEGNGAITAQRRGSRWEATGFAFVGCTITGTKTAFLGRPWGAYSRVIFALTNMSNVVLPQGWDNWNDLSKQRTVYYGEYKCYGAGAKRRGRVNWSRSLSSEEAAPFLTTHMIGGGSWIRMAAARH
ncbi:unnamed protein product [Cuscuta campestris]|uniref:pectinesterase n=1 Tax=Cuscuta campestris TaxID=132261 RepID=A0A484KIF1_9ASTE|nr:unnamed protein product [Cuscuta campestris]